VDRLAEEVSGPFENDRVDSDASTESASAWNRGPRAQLAAVLAAVLVCSIAAGGLWLRDVREPAPETGETPTISVTGNNDIPLADQSVVFASDNQDSEVADAYLGGSQVEAAPPTRAASVTIPVDQAPGPPVTRAASLAEVAVSPRGMSATTPADGAPSGRVMSATIAPTSGRPDAGSTSRVATVESGGALSAPLPGAITPGQTAISDAGSAASDDDRLSIERTLERYQRAYRELDVPAAAALWPTVDARALRRAFASVHEQDLVFRSCDIATTPEAATVHCVGDLTYVRRLGDTTRRAERHTWTIQLLRSGREWSVVGLSAH
jgi:hypothetical protein